MNPVIDSLGTKRWYNELGQLHRTDGPAVIWSDGTQFWCINGKLHRTDGPAIIYSTSWMEWYINGKLHRTDGPAFIQPNGYPEYWIYGNQLTEEEFNDIIQTEEHLNWYLLQL